MPLCLTALNGNVLIMLQRSCIWLMKSSHEKLGERIMKAVLYGCPLLMFLCGQQLLVIVRHKITAGHGDLISSGIVIFVFVV